MRLYIGKCIPEGEEIHMCDYFFITTYLPTHTVYQYKIYKKIIILGGYGHTGKCIQENIIFMKFCCCFKLSEKTEKLLKEQSTHAVAKCTLTGLVQ